LPVMNKPTGVFMAARTKRSMPTRARTRRGGRPCSAPNLGPGAFGENLTTIGVDVSGAVIGERWQIGSSELEVCQPRQPCYKLGIAFGDPGMLRRFAHAGRPGAYLRTVQEGELGAGDEVEIVWRPDHGITIVTVARAIVSDDSTLAIAATAPALPPALAAWMRERAGVTGSGM
jgi:MOSC domain-containing protein YiiM